jgi:nucleotide-binding universal stress UspA family protein
MSSGKVVIGFDGTPIAEHAVREAAELLAPRTALVVVVWEPGRPFELAEIPTPAMGMPASALDIRTAMRAEQALLDSARQMAQWGALVAAEAGLDAEGLAVADEISVADTLVRIAGETGAQAIVVGSHRQGRLSELVLGSTSRGVIAKASCPVLVVRGS